MEGLKSGADINLSTGASENGTSNHQHDNNNAAATAGGVTQPPSHLPPLLMVTGLSVASPSSDEGNSVKKVHGGETIAEVDSSIEGAGGVRTVWQPIPRNDSKKLNNNRSNTKNNNNGSDNEDNGSSVGGGLHNSNIDGEPRLSVRAASGFSLSELLRDGASSPDLDAAAARDDDLLGIVGGGGKSVHHSPASSVRGHNSNALNNGGGTMHSNSAFPASSSRNNSLSRRKAGGGGGVGFDNTSRPSSRSASESGENNNLSELGDYESVGSGSRGGGKLSRISSGFAKSSIRSGRSGTSMGTGSSSGPYIGKKGKFKGMTTHDIANTVGSKLGGQLGEFVAKLGGGPFGNANAIVPVDEEEEEKLEEEEEMAKLEAKATVQHRKKKRRPPRALIGSGNEADAEKSAFNFVMMIATLFALWGPDLYELCGPPDISNDRVLLTFSIVVLGLFACEFFFYSLFKPGYIGSFFFYLDFISAISLLPDSLLLWNIQTFSSGGSGLAVARAGRAARAGTRAARVVRIFKLFSLLRRKKKKDGEEDSVKVTTKTAPSKVGQALSNGIIQKVIVIVALMLISSQMLDLIASANQFSTIDQSVDATLDTLSVIFERCQRNVTCSPFYELTIDLLDYYNHPTSSSGSDFATHFTKCPPSSMFPQLMGKAAQSQEVLRECTIRHLQIMGHDIWGSADSYADLRTNPAEWDRTQTPATNSIFVMATVDSARSDALVNIVTVLFISVLLAISSALFQRDSDILVIAPLELMAGLIRQIAEDPLNPLVIDETRSKIDSETKLVAMAISKLSKMLQVGFGEAGASIIQANMVEGKDRIQPVLPGKRIQGIYGFCDIRNFTDCTECLQTDVMVFVNRISDFVHRAVKENEGAPNKNIGDAFLLVWKLPDRTTTASGRTEPITTADSALKSFVRIIIETAADEQLLALTSRKVVQDRIPGYAVRMGFGLHVGWGIEGPIGSVLKIDATYLSPNVNMCARLEGATKTYGCVMLLTDAFYDLLSPPVQRLCRRVDRVTARGSVVPFDLYTFDAVRFPDLDTMREGTNFWERFPPTTSGNYRAKFGLGVKAYIAGEWATAKKHLDDCLFEIPHDGPCNFLLRFMEETKFVCPASWPGYRTNGVD